MSKLTSRQMLKAHNTTLKAQLFAFKKQLRFTELITDITGASFLIRVTFAYKLVFKKL